MYQRIEHEEKVMKEMSKVSRLSEIQHTLDNDILPKQNKMQDVSGEWICFTTMSSKGYPGNGIMYIRLSQNDTKLEGDLQQIKNPHNEEIIYKYDENGQIKGKYAAALKGEIIVASGEKVRHNMIILHRRDLEGNFRAIFTGSVAADGNSIIAQLTNNMGHYGTMLMMRRELLMQY
jgi:YD repeat-containing protein